MAKKKPTPKGSTALRAKTADLDRMYHEQLVENATFSRSSLSRQLNDEQDPRRSIDDDCGFPKHGNITPEEYKEMYDRMPIATRVVQVLPRESWQVTPIVQETEDMDVETQFEKDWKELPKKLSGPSWHEAGDEGGNAIWEFLLRGDIQSGIGDYGVMLLGLDDLAENETLEKPVDSVVAGTPSTDERELSFIRIFDQVNAQIHSYDVDKGSPRFGQPEFYNLTFNEPQGNTTGINVPTGTEKVHWSRCIHLADNLGSSEIIGTPRQQPVYNNELSLRKMYGGSAEMYWRGAFPGLSIETHPQLGGDVVFDEEATKDDIEQYMNSLQRYITTTGMHVNSLAPQVSDPTPQIRVQIEAICILLGIPIRVFMGSERGELASGQDDETWNDRLRVRQSMYITPRIIVPFIDRLILAGVLTEPEQYTTKWPDLDSPSDSAQAEIAVNVTKALTEYVQGGVEALIPPMDYLVDVLHFDKERVKVIIDAAMAQEELLTGDDDTEGQPNDNVGSET